MAKLWQTNRFSLVVPSLLLQTIKILLIATPTETIKIPKHVVQEQPKIWMSGYMEVDSYQIINPLVNRSHPQDQFKNDFVSKNGSDFVVTSESYAVFFSCEAEYPITWKFKFPAQLEFAFFQYVHLLDVRLSDLSIDAEEPTNKRFHILFLVESSRINFLSVNLTCSSIDSKPQELQSNVYIFFDGGKTNIENEGKTLNVTLEPSKPPRSSGPPLVLPCRPSSPDIKLSLEKEVVTSIHIQPNKKRIIKKAWKPLSLLKTYISFDPKVGFIMQRGLLGDRIFGLYKCSVVITDDDSDGEVNDSEQFVLVNVTKRNSQDEVDDHHRDIPFESRSVLHGKASVHINDSRITCCSGVEDKPPIMFIKNCESSLHCQLVKKAVVEMLDPESENELKNPVMLGYHKPEKTPSDCEHTFLYGTSEVVACKGDNVDFVEQYFNLFRPMAGGPVTSRSKSELDPAQGKIKFLTHYGPSSIAQSAAINQKIFITVGRRIRKRKDRKLEQGMYFLSKDAIFIYDDDTKENRDKITKLRNKPVNVLEYNRDVYYEGEPLLFMCFGAKFAYSREAHLRLNWKNGSKSSLEETHATSPVFHYRLYLAGNFNFGMSGNGEQLASFFGRTIRASQGMKSVDCWMPVKNSSGWEKSSKDIKILASEAPKFEEKSEETLYFHLGDSGNVVTCTLVGGLPRPTLRVIRDGRNIILSYNISNSSVSTTSIEGDAYEINNGTDKLRFPITLDFSNIEYHHQLVLQCIAKNVNGTTTRTVRIVVIDKPSNSKALPISLSLVGVLCLLVIGLGVKRWHAKQTAATLRTSTNLL